MICWNSMLIVVSCLAAVAPLHAGETDTVITYQGRLMENGAPANGMYDMSFVLFPSEAGGSPIAFDIPPAISVVDGVFTVKLDFGAAAFDNADRWLQVIVEGTPIFPCQQITRAPYAIQTRGINVAAGGNVGIGTSLPAIKLHVDGSALDAIIGITGGEGATGVWGIATHFTGVPVAVRGEVFSPNGYAGYFLGGQSYFEGNVGIGTLEPEAPLHVMAGSAGAVSANSNSIMVLERATGGFLSILAPDGASKGVMFGNASDASSGSIIYDQVSVASEAMQFRTGGNQTRMIITDIGNVGIDVNAPAFLLHVNGDAGKPGGGSWTNTSDARLKKNVPPLVGSLDALLALQGVTFEYINPKAINELPGERIGMVAQQVEETFPDWVEERRDGYKTVTYRGFEALAVEALRELRAEKDAEIAALQQQVDELKALVQELAEARRPSNVQ
jgi:hypothetical protein